ncbi:alkaline phosphatase family protein [Stackebrandtia soli]|uniref:alkaline phosphatase family protein n=1 Tax=Stackebrandtia soli TaxID=1892856 RepID=UPI0039EA7CD8
MVNRVVVFGIDGVRLDRLHTAHTPHLDTITANGFLAPVRIPDVNPTISGPCWATVATGVTADVHGIRNNDLHGHRLADHPCFLRRASDAGLATYAAAGWLPLLPNEHSEYHGGAIFAPGRSYLPPRPAHSKSGGDAVSDLEVAANAAHTLRHEDIHLAFVYFGQVDEVGHEEGTGSAYDKAITQADACVGTVLDAIASRPDRADDTWTYLAVTDHGHRDGGGHGGDSDLERTAWIAGSDAALIADSGALTHADMPRLALSPFGLAFGTA